jgi:hypothetical protein
MMVRGASRTGVVNFMLYIFLEMPAPAVTDLIDFRKKRIIFRGLASSDSSVRWKLACPFCGKRVYKQKDARLKHIFSAHYSEINPAEVDNVKCMENVYIMKNLVDFLEQNGYACRNFRLFKDTLTQNGFSEAECHKIMKACQHQAICFFNGPKFVKDVEIRPVFVCTEQTRPNDINLSKAKLFLDAKSKVRCATTAIRMANEIIRDFPLCDHKAGEKCSCMYTL